jgi:hypothetical protein
MDSSFSWLHWNSGYTFPMAKLEIKPLSDSKTWSLPSRLCCLLTQSSVLLWSTWSVNPIIDLPAHFPLQEEISSTLQSHWYRDVWCIIILQAEYLSFFLHKLLCLITHSLHILFCLIWAIPVIGDNKWGTTKHKMYYLHEWLSTVGTLIASGNIQPCLERFPAITTQGSLLAPKRLRPQLLQHMAQIQLPTTKNFWSKMYIVPYFRSPDPQA